MKKVNKDKSAVELFTEGMETLFQDYKRSLTAKWRKKKQRKSINK